MRRQELILYRIFQEDRDRLLREIAELAEDYEDGIMNKAVGGTRAEREMAARLYGFLHGLLELAGTYGFHGNLWHCYLAHLLVTHENSYSRSCEMRGAVLGTVNHAALHDMEIFKEFFDYDCGPICERRHVAGFSMAEDYQGNSLESRVYNARICARICELAVKLGQAATAEEMKAVLTDFYREYGVGKLGLHKCFRIGRDEDGRACIQPVPRIAHVRLEDLVGYEIPKEKLINNTDAFVAGRAANNCLLFGDAGTGKSSCIKAIANEYYDKGLRVIEVYKHQFQDLNRIISQIKGRNYKFIIFMDDLSFEDFEIEYKYLKAVIEGGLEKKPENVLIYATSNRRHLIRENYGDKTEDGSLSEARQDMHTSDTVQEKLSLVYRFGVTIYFGAPDKKQFQGIVKVLAERNGVNMPQEELFLAANKWELAHGGLSGRTAQQFIDYLKGSGDL